MCEIEYSQMERVKFAMVWFLLLQMAKRIQVFWDCNCQKELLKIFSFFREVFEKIILTTQK